MRRGEAVQGGMRADEVVEKEEHGNEVVCRNERGKALFGFVPCLELLVEALNEIVGNIIVETLNADVFYPMQRFNGHLVGEVAVAHNSLRSPHRLHSFQYGKRLRAVPVAVQVETKDKAGFAVQNEPEVVFPALYFDHGFIGVPLVRVEIERRNELYGHVLEQRGEIGTPVADGGMGNLDIHHGTQNQGDIAEGVFAQVEHTQGHENHMDGIAHPFEIRLSKEPGHGRRRDGSRLWHKDGMAAFPVTAGIVDVMLPVVMHIHCFSTDRADWIFFCPGTAHLPLSGIWCPLMRALPALILLMTMFVFSVATKVRFVVALWTA